jgi:hypothetical protein
LHCKHWRSLHILLKYIKVASYHFYPLGTCTFWTLLRQLSKSVARHRIITPATFCLQAVLLHITEELGQVDCFAVTVKLSDLPHQNSTFFDWRYEVCPFGRTC